MKLTEDLSDVDDKPAVEEIVGTIDVEEDQSRLEYYQRSFKSNIVAPARIAWNDWRAKFGFFVVSVFVFMATVWHRAYGEVYRGSVPILVRPFDSSYMQEIYGIPFWQYPLGTNQRGQDMLQLIVNAAPAMLELVIAGAVVSTGIGVLFGVVAGYKGGFVDRFLMFLTDIVLTIPGLPLIVLLAAIFQPQDPFLLGMLLAIDAWPGLARSLRSQVLTLRSESYVEASRTMNVSDSSILLVDILPGLMPYILINAARAGRSVITQAVALYFLNFINTETNNWGLMMDRAYQYGAVTNLDIFYLMLWPAGALAMVSFGLVLLAQGLDQIFNPRLRARHIHDDEEEEQPDPTNA